MSLVVGTPFAVLARHNSSVSKVNVRGMVWHCSVTLWITSKLQASNPLQHTAQLMQRIEFINPSNATTSILVYNQYYVISIISSTGITSPICIYWNIKRVSPCCHCPCQLTVVAVYSYEALWQPTHALFTGINIKQFVFTWDVCTST